MRTCFITMLAMACGSPAPEKNPTADTATPQTPPTPTGSTAATGDTGVPVTGDDLDQDGYTVQQGDCDDQDPARHPGALEACDNVDNDCNDQIDDGFAASIARKTGTIAFPTVDEAVAEALKGGDPVVDVCPAGPTPVAIATVDLDGTALELDGVAGRDATALTANAGFLFANVRNGGSLTLRGIDVAEVPTSTAISVRQGTLVLVDCRVRGTSGGAIRLNTAAIATITRCEIVDNDAGNLAVGGGITAGGDIDLTIEDSLIARNRANRGAGVWVTGGDFASDVQIAIRRTTIRDNVATGAAYLSGIGGGIGSVASGTEIAMNDCTLSGNQAEEGGGAYLLRTTLGLTDSTVEGNTATFGGGVFVDTDSWLHSINSSWGAGGSDNTPEDVAIEGGGTYTWDGSASFVCQHGGTCAP